MSLEAFREALVEAERLIRNPPFEVTDTELAEGLDYLAGSIRAVGLDPAALPAPDAAGDIARYKAWSEIWGSGQGIGAVRDVVPAAERIARLKAEYDAACAAA